MGKRQAEENLDKELLKVISIHVHVNIGLRVM